MVLPIGAEEEFAGVVDLVQMSPVERLVGAFVVTPDDLKEG